MFCGGIFNIIAEKKDVQIWQLCPLPCSCDFATALPHVIARAARPVAIRTPVSLRGGLCPTWQSASFAMRCIARLTEPQGNGFPHQCAHWFGMTRKATLFMSLRGSNATVAISCRKWCHCKGLKSSYHVNFPPAFLFRFGRCASLSTFSPGEGKKIPRPFGRGIGNLLTTKHAQQEELLTHSSCHICS